MQPQSYLEIISKIKVKPVIIVLFFQRIDAMKLNHRQKAIIQFAIANNNQITKKQAVDLIGGSYYHNGAKYVGEILSRLVGSQALKRIKPGLYEVLTGHASKNIIQKNNPNQINLF